VREYVRVIIHGYADTRLDSIWSTRQIYRQSPTLRCISGSGEETPGIRMNRHGSQIGAKVGGRNRRGTREEKGADELWRNASKNASRFAHAFSHGHYSVRRLPSWLPNDRYAISKKKKKKGKSKNVRRERVRSTVFQCAALNHVTFIAA